MAYRVKKKNVPKIITIIINLVLFIAVLFLMTQVKNLLNTDTKASLEEVVTQNKDAITSRLNAEINEVSLSANRFSDRMEGRTDLRSEQLTELLKEVAETSGGEISVALSDGNAVFLDGQVIDISGRQYFRLALKGIQNISDKMISRTDGEELFVLSVPLKINNKIVGTFQKRYSPEEMSELCSISLFSEQGYMNIINREGYILISSQNNAFNPERDNYFRKLFSAGNEKESTTLQKRIKQEKSGLFEASFNGKKIYSVYTPINGVHDWYLITSIAEAAISPNGSIVIKIFYVILMTIVLVSCFSLFYFFRFKNKQQENLERLAFVDDITEGDTYTKFIVEYNEIVAKYPKKSFALLKFDVDNFKYVNNYYGFAVGDKVLYQIYRKVKNLLFEDEIICRISSDNFVVLLKEYEQSRLEEMMETMQSEEGFNLYLSAGIYEITKEEDLALMIDKAGMAAQLSKGSLIKKVEKYNESFDRQMIQNEQMKRAVQEAIKEDLFVPYYQPKVNVKTNQIIGAEGLARWITKEGKIISPNDFIPLSEKSGLIVEIDMMIFEKVLQFLKKQLEAGEKCVPISINFSRNHLHSSDFVEKIKSKIELYKVPAALIEVEITESAFFNNIDIMNSFVCDLHKIGVRVSMDDFGSGYSSLNMLKDIQVDVIKIDKTFLMETKNGEKQKIIFTSISKMAKQLDISVVVEGVETEEHIQLMKLSGCSIAQGFYYSKPVSEEHFIIFKEEH